MCAYPPYTKKLGVLMSLKNRPLQIERLETRTLRAADLGFAEIQQFVGPVELPEDETPVVVALENDDAGQLLETVEILAQSNASIPTFVTPVLRPASENPDGIFQDEQELDEVLFDRDRLASDFSLIENEVSSPLATSDFATDQRRFDPSELGDLEFDAELRGDDLEVDLLRR